MTDTQELQTVIAESGLKYKFIADKLGITPYTFQKKVKNRTEFKASEIMVLVELLSLSERQREAIFFAVKSDKKSPNEKSA